MACFGLISTAERGNEPFPQVRIHGRTWRITAEGLTYLERNHA